MCTTKGINRKEVMADQTTICKSLNSYSLLDGESDRYNERKSIITVLQVVEKKDCCGGGIGWMRWTVLFDRQ